MVKVEDITEESKKLNSKLSLARKSFSGAYDIFLDDLDFPPTSINVMAPFKRRISFINIKKRELILYDQSYIEKAKKFAEEYEQRFKEEGEFTIQTELLWSVWTKTLNFNLSSSFHS